MGGQLSCSCLLNAQLSKHHSSNGCPSHLRSHLSTFFRFASPSPTAGHLFFYLYTLPSTAPYSPPLPWRHFCVLQSINLPCYPFHCIFQPEGLLDDHIIFILPAFGDERCCLCYESYNIPVSVRSKSFIGSRQWIPCHGRLGISTSRPPESSTAFSITRAPYPRLLLVFYKASSTRSKPTFSASWQASGLRTVPTWRTCTLLRSFKPPRSWKHTSKRETVSTSKPYCLPC